jgi:hypothetical protein
MVHLSTGFKQVSAGSTAFFVCDYGVIGAEKKLRSFSFEGKEKVDTVAFSLFDAERLVQAKLWEEIDAVTAQRMIPGCIFQWDDHDGVDLETGRLTLLLPKESPKESPEDWVIQDRVPARAGIDRGHFGNSFKSPEDMWGFIAESMGIGEMHGSNDLVVYCRRKDLPGIELKAQPRTVVIIRWLCWNEDGDELLISAAVKPDAYKNCLNVGEEKFEVTL